MKRRWLLMAGAAITGLGVTLGPAGATPTAYDPEPPPSSWGPDDEAGNTNTQTAAKVLEAVQLIRTGEKFRLAHVYEPSMPMFPGNSWALTMRPTVSVERQSFNAEEFAGQIGQNGTQLDAFGHFGVLPENTTDPHETLYYNRFTGRQVHGPAGLQKLGVEKLKAFFTRGVLIDVALHETGSLDGVLEPGTEIGLDAVLDTLAAQGMSEHDIGPGDVVLIRTGWEKKWKDGTAAYYAGVASAVPGSTPGIGLPVARWLAGKGVACVGSDNWGIEAAGIERSPGHPSYVPGVPFPVHNELLVRAGIPLQESMHLEELAAAAARDWAAGGKFAKNAYRFAYVFAPLLVKGASGSPGVPMAVR